MALELALEGGNPVRCSMLRYATQTLDDDDRAAVDQVLRGDWLTTGPAVAEFEQALCDQTGAQHAVAMNSGTAALHAAVAAAGIVSGDEVIVPTISFVASANCVLYQSGVPVFADLSADTLNVAPAEVERCITPRTKAIIAVDFAGHPCDYNALREIARAHDLPIIEDGAHALGAAHPAGRVGTLNEFTIFSFHPVKQITTGEGGAVMTDDQEIAKRMRSFRHHGIDLDLHARGARHTWEYDVINLGFNYRIPDINCALGISQLRKLDDWIERRRQIAHTYREGLAGCPMLELPTERCGYRSAWHLYVVRLNADRVRYDRARVFAALRAENIGVNVHYIPIPWMTQYAKLGYARGQWPVAEREYERILTLPMYPAMTDADANDVVEAVEKVWQAYRA